MVDNKKEQWEDIEYTEDSFEESSGYDDGDETYTDEQEAVDENSEQYGEYEDYEEEDDAAPKKKSAVVPIIILLILLLAGAGIMIPKMLANKESTTVNNTQTYQQENQFDNQNTPQQSQEDLAGSFFDAANDNNQDMMSVNFNDNNEGANVMSENGDNQQVATVTDPQQNNSNNINEVDLFANQDENQGNDIMVVYNKATRLNPFKPPVITETANKDVPFETIDNMQYEIIEPPTKSTYDENLTKLLQTQISGIMYDANSPSAIVNLNGKDQFVKIGDVISGYKIENITKDKVQISYKNNSYVATVGELFTQGDLDKQQAIVNLENKFGGRYKNNNN